MTDLREHENALVRSKDKLLRMLGEGKLEEVRRDLEVLRDWWESVGYGYKLREVERRICESGREKE